MERTHDTSIIVGRWDGRQWYDCRDPAMEQAYTEIEIIDPGVPAAKQLTEQSLTRSRA